MSEITSRNLKSLTDSDEVLNSVTKEIEQSESALSNWKRKLVKWYELYKMVQSKKHYEGLANIFVPEVLRAVETVSGNLYRAIVGHSPWFEYRGREESDNPSAASLTQLTNYQMEENSFKSRLMDSLRQMAITGLTVRKILWDFKQIRRRKKVARVTDVKSSLTGEIKQKRLIEDEDNIDTVSDTWTFEPVNLLNFHVSDITTPYNDIQKAKWIGEQFLVEKQWIADRIKKGWLSKDQMSKIDEDLSKTDGKAPTSSASDLNNQKNHISGFDFSNQNITKGKIEIIERWGLVPAKWVHDKKEMKKLDLDKDDMVEGVIVIANRKAILKLEANPFWHGQKPYVSAPYIPQEGELPGMGIAQIAESLQEELNDTRNQTMDNKTLVLANMWLKSRNSGIRNKDLRVRPMGVIPTNDMNGLKALRPPILTGTGVNIEGVIKNDLRESVGAPSNLQGIAQSGVSTATESSMLNREGFARLNQVAEMYGLLIIKPMLIMAEFLNYQFYDRVKVITIIGEKGVKFRNLAPEEIVGNKDVVVSLTTDSDDSPAVKRQQIIQFFTIVQQMPPDLIEFHWNMLNAMYKQFFPKGDLSDIYEAPPKAEELLSVDEETDLILGEAQVLAKRGQDHEGHNEKHQQDLEAMQYAMSDKQLEFLQKLIQSHEALLQAEREAELKQAIADKEEQLNQTNNGASKNKIDNGRTPNATPFTNKSATTTGQVIRNTRVGQ